MSVLASNCPLCSAGVLVLGSCLKVPAKILHSNASLCSNHVQLPVHIHCTNKPFDYITIKFMVNQVPSVEYIYVPSDR